MKILHVLDHSIPLHSGYTFRTRNILRQQRELGWETCHATSIKHLGAEAEVEEVDGLRFYRTRNGSGLLAKIPVLNQLDVVNSLAKRLEKVIDLEKPDILHAHSPALNGLAALKAARKNGLPVVYECRAFWEDAAVDHGTSSEWGARYRITRAMESHVFRKADAVTTICEGLRGEIISRGIASDKITVIPNAVDIAHFEYEKPRNEALAKELGLEDKTVLGFIGSFYAYEGIPLLLESLPELARMNPQLRVLLVGGGPQEETIKSRIADLGLDDLVVLTGRIPHESVQDYYGLVDLFVYPRLSMRLTDLVTPLKPLEAMAQGHLVLASDVGGHRELIRHGSNGYLFKAGDSAALAREVLYVLEQRDEWSSVRSNGRDYVEEERNWSNSVARYQSVYEGLLS